MATPAGVSGGCQAARTANVGRTAGKALPGRSKPGSTGGFVSGSARRQTRAHTYPPRYRRTPLSASADDSAAANTALKGGQSSKEVAADSIPWFEGWVQRAEAELRAAEETEASTRGGLEEASARAVSLRSKAESADQALAFATAGADWKARLQAGRMAAQVRQEAQAAQAEVLRLEGQLVQACARVRAAAGTKKAATAGMSALMSLQAEEKEVLEKAEAALSLPSTDGNVKDILEVENSGQAVEENGGREQLQGNLVPEAMLAATNKLYSVQDDLTVQMRIELAELKAEMEKLESTMLDCASLEEELWTELQSLRPRARPVPDLQHTVAALEADLSRAQSHQKQIEENVLKVEIQLRELKFAFEEAMHNWTAVNNHLQGSPGPNEQDEGLQRMVLRQDFSLRQLADVLAGLEPSKIRR
mmetsp:Transcript_17096/g.47707  ORF Transcript_17096/g.47707 Transcript_17096/m.47707 type:complete len:419 (+) Transcript_17096:167-1423(+)